LTGSAPRFLEGLTAAMVTPYESRGGPIDYGAAAQLASWLVNGGGDAVLVGGSTGELSLIGPQEEARLVSKVAEAVDGRASVLAGVPPAPLEVAVEWGRLMVESGAEAVLVPPPHYLEASPRGLVEYYTSLASRLESPLILYHVPLHAGSSVPAEVAARIAVESSNVVAVKATTRDPTYVADVLRESDGRLRVLAGLDEAVLLALAYGATGAIVGLANVVPTTFRRLLGAWVHGQYSQALEAQAEVERVLWALRAGASYQGAIKAALSMMGLPVKPHVRPPLPPETEETLKAVRERLKLAGLLEEE